MACLFCRIFNFQRAAGFHLLDSSELFPAARWNKQVSCHVPPGRATRMGRRQKPIVPPLSSPSENARSTEGKAGIRFMVGSGGVRAAPQRLNGFAGVPIRDPESVMTRAYMQRNIPLNRRAGPNAGQSVLL
jgi:hypothetical protein